MTAPESQTVSHAIDAPGRRKTWLRLATLLLGVCGGFLVAEILLLVTGWADPPTSKRRLADANRPGMDFHCYTSNPHGELSPLPDLTTGRWTLSTFSKRQLPLDRAEETPWCVQYRYSSWGTRGKEIAPSPEPGQTRIAIVGDSFVFGEGVPEERTLPAILAARLGPRCEVLNGGKSGANTADEVTTARGFVEALGATRIVVVWVPNDVELTPALAQRRARICDLMNFRDELVLLHISQQWYAHSRVLRLLGLAIDMRRIDADTRQWYRDMYDPVHNAENLHRLSLHLAQFPRTSEVRTALVLYPLLDRLDGEYPLLDAHRAVAERARAVGLPVLDLQPLLRTALAGNPTSTLWVHPTDRHPNGRAHRIAADAIAAWLQGAVDGFLNPLTTPPASSTP